MAETMTVESIVEADWLLQKYWTKSRFPFQTENGAWSDIDLLAYCPTSKHLVVAESKVRGTKKSIYAYTERTRKDYGPFGGYDGRDYLGFCRHLPLICKDGVVFDRFRRMVKRITVQLVSNYFVQKDVLRSATESIRKMYSSYLPKNMKCDIRLESTLEVICRIIKNENEHIQGRRYGHPIMDVARELNRYMHPQVHTAGRGRQATDRVKEDLKQILSSVLFGKF